jgi:Carboxypeptidase regulatory-like domain/TonB-dependent Receptor Plug Domain
MMWKRPWSVVFLVLLTIVASAPSLFGQTDQGTITGVVQDTSGAVVGTANVTLISLDTGLTLKSKTDAAGVYVFSPIKIGNYSVTASATGFETTTQTNLHVSIQQRLNVVISMKPGATSETVTVTTEEPLLQTQESSVGQTMDTQTIDSVPLNGRNWVYIAQLAPGAAPPTGSRGAGKGDFQANGQRAEQNNFILDGVDNNVNVVDFYNGASFVAQPPPDALQEFKVQTSNYSAEFGHSAGAVLNASLKSGTNSIHGNL